VTGGWSCWLGRYGKTDNGVVTVTTLWADEQVYYQVHAVPYTSARHFAKEKNDPEFRTRLVIGAGLAVLAREAGFTFRAVVADSGYGDQDGFRAELAEAGLPFVMALRRWWATWSNAPPPSQLQALINSVAAGRSLHLYIPN
jgi:SRSO17 transposase